MLGKSSQCARAGADHNNGGGARKLGSVAITSSSPCRRFLAVIAARSSLLRLLQLSVAAPRWDRDGGTGHFKSWRGPKFSRTLDTLRSIASQQN